jgi:hypothetical protein
LCSSATNFIVSVPASTTAPVISPLGGTYLIAPLVLLGDSLTNAAIHYTTNGSIPTASSPIYTGPISLSAGKTVKAVAHAMGCTPSPIASAQFGIPTRSGVIALVNNLNDSGAGSLRSAIEISNETSGSVVTFGKTLSGTILLKTALPEIGAKTTVLWPDATSVEVLSCQPTE